MDLAELGEVGRMTVSAFNEALAGHFRGVVLWLGAMFGVFFGVVGVAGAACASESFAITSFATSVSSLQAGAHADFTTSFSLSREVLGGPAGQAKNLSVVLPEGLAGDPQDIPRCTPAELTEFDCQPSAQVGVLISRFSFPAKNEGEEPEEAVERSGVYNMVPSPGHPATFATSIALANVLIQADVKRDGTYRLVANVHEISTLEPLVSTSLTMWGVPADPSHDALRFGPPPNYGTPTSADAAPAPFMFNSSDCSDGPLKSEITMESWTGEESSATTSMPAPTGCGILHAAPSLSVVPETTQAASPSGYEVDLHFPQELEPYGVMTPDLRDSTITLPAGTVLSPSIANGLQACSEEQVGWEKKQPTEVGHANGNPVACPAGSKVGTVELVSPLLGSPLKGSMYTAAEYANPFGSLIAIYLIAEGEGVQVKLAGHVVANPGTGQLSTTFLENPKVPASDIKVVLKGGPRAALSNPRACGAATTTSLLTFYSSPIPLEPSSAFDVSGCSSQFAPSVVASSTPTTAGAFGPFSVTIARTDADQYLSAVQVTGEPGMGAILGSVPLCPEPGAAQGVCPASSEIGHTVVGAGAGVEPVVLPQAGESNPVYLTGGYKGAPFGLVAVVPAVAGPFNLGDVVVRAAINVNPQTGQPVITTDAFPQILKGIPVQARSIDAVIDRSGFVFNPTGCEPESVTGVITSAEGASATVQAPYQITSCNRLTFKPVFKASTQGNGTFKGHGASLTVQIETHEGPTSAGGGEANIARADVQLPVELPSRDATLQKACTEQQFAANPAGCPAASLVGSATVSTPDLAVPLQGPAIIVSHAGAAFPDLDLILSGNGVTVQLTGHTQIKNGITYSHFETVPDAPVSSFELKLPEGPNSILAAFLKGGTLCTPTVTKTVTIKSHGHTRHVKRIVPAPLLMPTTLVSQTGQVLKQTTKIAVTGCPAAKKTTKAKTGRARAGTRTARSTRKAAH